MKRILSMLMSTIMLLSITGCWDQVEMNKRAYVLSIGIDEYDQNSAQISIITEDREPKYNFLFEIATLKKSQQDQSNSQQESFFITVGAHSIPEALSTLETTIENPTILT